MVDVAPLIAEGRLDEAVATLSDALSRAPRQTDLLYNLAQAQRLQGRHDEARRTALKAAEISPGDDEVHLLLAEIHLELGEIMEVNNRFNRVSSEGRSTPRAQYLLGILSTHLGDLRQAEAALRSAIDLGDASASAKAALAYVVIAQGRVEEGKALLQQAETTPDQSSAAIRQLAECYLKLGDAQRALTLARSLEPEQRNDAQLWALIGRSNVKLLRFGESESAFTRALAAPNATPWHQVQYAEMLFAAQREGEALNQALAAEERLSTLRQPMRDPSLYNLLATLYARRDQGLLAHRYLQMSLRIDSQQPVAQRLMREMQEGPSSQAPSGSPQEPTLDIEP